jgi:hypothetical protein
MQPRIYTYKITFEEVPYYYYGSKKEKKYNEEYWGSPITNRWCWELYTPRKQILETFDYTDEGYGECLSIENRLIKPFLNDPYCLNEHCGGFCSLESFKRGGQKTKELCIGVHGRTKEQMSENGKKGTQRCKELGVGIYSLSSEQKSENGKKGGELTKELCIGVHGRTKEQMIEQGKKNYEQGIGIFGYTSEQKSENGKKGGELIKNLGKGIFSFTIEQRKENAKKGGKQSNSQKWQCSETGFISTSGPLTLYQNKRGIDTSKRIRIK